MMLPDVFSNPPEKKNFDEYDVFNKIHFDKQVQTEYLVFMIRFDILIRTYDKHLSIACFELGL